MVSLPMRELAGMPKLMSSGSAPVPALATAEDKARLYARPVATSEGAAIEDSRWYATYFRVAMGFESGTQGKDGKQSNGGKLVWAHLHGTDFVGGAATSHFSRRSSWSNSSRGQPSRQAVVAIASGHGDDPLHAFRPVWRCHYSVWAERRVVAPPRACLLGGFLLDLFRLLRAGADLDLARPHGFGDLANKIDREQSIHQISARHLDVVRH